VENVLGLIGIFLFIVVIICLAAGVTWVVVRFSPNPNKKRAA
jgi:Na+-transporting methylmalonyl-CoA/oxaloacetate decarboxylase gamma subunit